MAPKKKPATNAAGAKKSTKQQEKEQREQIKKQLVEIESQSKGSVEYRLDSLFDAALGLELWLLDNKKAFPAEAVTQKCQRLGEIAKMATLKTLNAEDAYWELAGLYNIIHREASRKELKLQKPNFIFPSVSLPCLPPDDTISVTELEEIIGCPLTAEALDAKIAELEAEEKIRQMTE
jgi:hypothetical protein|tara:strand:+ start:5853 stop:6386 length:534 start_codon:yes stop_codon:yes gene_type:complete